MIKLIMTWNVREGKENEYLEFLTRDFAKSILEMGLQPTDAWYAVWGQGPQALAGGVANDLESMEKALTSGAWRSLQEKLSGIAVDFEHKVIEATGGFQL